VAQVAQRGDRPPVRHSRRPQHRQHPAHVLGRAVTRHHQPAVLQQLDRDFVADHRPHPILLDQRRQRLRQRAALDQLDDVTRSVGAGELGLGEHIREAGEAGGARNPLVDLLEQLDQGLDHRLVGPSRLAGRADLRRRLPRQPGVEPVARLTERLLRLHLPRRDEMLGDRAVVEDDHEQRHGVADADELEVLDP
jgi:hypothetical protein